MSKKNRLNISTFGLLLATTFFQVAYGQSEDQKIAKEKGMEAVRLMDKGNVDESIELLEEAQKLDPENMDYPYELGYAYYAKKDFKKALKYLEKLTSHKDVNNRVYQLLGNTYDNLGKPEKAIETYEKGLKLFPASGNLYLELGVMQLGKKDFNAAMAYFESGIDAEPDYSSNYYWAAKLFCNSTEEVWGMIYGELFMNLERNSNRTSEISKVLYDTYKSEIKMDKGTYSVSFSQNNTITLSDLSNPEDFKLPFGIGAYEPTLMLSLISVKSISIHSLDTVRGNFVDQYYSTGNDKKYPNALFAYQKQVKDNGHLEAYNHWILMKGDEDGFVAWKNANTGKWDAFVDWFMENGIQLNETNKFLRTQY